MSFHRKKDPLRHYARALLLVNFDVIFRDEGVEFVKSSDNNVERELEELFKFAEILTVKETPRFSDF